uniref:Uncharacterized protein n=1 Tax=Physcomitrium patens TaxID=3218 RepID=A0A2K1KJS6_PHYPA|nr:hypothetical protein PHYPA_007706 [Physcomitrium patens]
MSKFQKNEVKLFANFKKVYLRNLLNGLIIISRLFIKGRYISGSNEVQKLYKDGKLSDLLKNFLVVQIEKACDGYNNI